MGQRLVQANLKNDVKILDEVGSLLAELKGAWDAIRLELVGALPQPNVSGNSPKSYTSA